MKMYRIIMALLVLLAGIPFLASCSENSNIPFRNSFQVETERIEESGKHLNIKAEIPEFSGFPGADALNAEIASKAEAAAAEVREAATAMSGYKGNYTASLRSRYQYFQHGNLASAWISWDNYTGGAHGLYWLDSVTFNTQTGEIYTFPGLFREGSDGIKYVTDKILNKIAQNEYFNTATETVSNYSGNYQYLINGDNIVVYFPLYEIAPYAAGIQSFTFTLDELKDFLKPEVAEAMKGQPGVSIPFLEREPENSK